MSTEAKEFVQHVRAVRAGEKTAAECGFPSAISEPIKALSEKDIAILEEMYDTILEAPIFRNNKFATMTLSVQVVGKMKPEMIKSALSEMNYIRSGALREADVNLDGARLFYKRGQSAFESEQFPKAKNYFARAVEIAPNYKEAWFALAGTCELLGMSEQASEAFRRAQELQL
jgi:tetratricopeptide (TPR) repeat protein